VINNSYKVNIYIFNTKAGGNHSGVIQFRLCEAPEDGDPSKDCFEMNKLKFENGATEVNLNSSPGIRRFKNGDPDTVYHMYKVYLPQGKTCKHCLLQSHWIGAFTQRFISKCLILDLLLKIIH